MTESDNQPAAAFAAGTATDGNSLRTAPRIAILDHFRASRLAPGDVVMAIRQRFDTRRNAPESLEVRMFLASASERAGLVELDAQELVAHDGGLLFAELIFPSTDPDEYHWNVAEGRRARIARLTLSGARAAARSTTARQLAPWLLDSLEAELRFAGIATLDVHASGVDEEFAAELTARGYETDRDGSLARSLVPTLAPMRARA